MHHGIIHQLFDLILFEAVHELPSLRRCAEICTLLDLVDMNLGLLAR